MMKRKQQAFTLVELMVTIAVMAILMAIAIPSFTTMIANNRSSSMGREIAAAVSLARAEAIKRGSRVSICVSSNGTSCATAGTAWNNGWLVFVDSATSDTAATPIVGAQIKYQQGSARASVNVTSGGGAALSFIRFTGQGLLARTATIPITITAQYSGCQGANAQRIEVGPAGRMSPSRQNCT